MEKVKKALNSEDINKALTKILEEGIGEIVNMRYSQGLEILKKVEKKLEIVVNQGIVIDQDIILPTLHNIALCSQAIGDFQECSAYIEACIYNVRRKTEFSSSNSNSVAERIRKIRYLCLLYIQLSDCFSKLDSHKKALDNAKLAAKQCTLAVRLCLNAFSESKLKKQSISMTTSKKKTTVDFYSNSIQLLQGLYTQMLGKKTKKISKDMSIRSVLGVQRISEWIFTLTFEKITEIKPLALSDLKAPHSLRAELSKDFMLDKICMSTASYYLMSRELSFLNEDPIKAKSLHQKAMTIGTIYFPTNCPFLQQIIKEFSDKHQKTKEYQKIKSPFRSTSAKETRTVYQVVETTQKLSTPKKKHYDIKKIPWKIQSERNPHQNPAIDKGSHTQSDSNISLSNMKSPPCFEKTEPEPPLSEESEQEDIIKNFIISSNDLYGNYSEEEIFDKYEYMPLRRT
jgi:hypothetical protein